jgi:hypothetical protein
MITAVLNSQRNGPVGQKHKLRQVKQKYGLILIAKFHK